MEAGGGSPRQPPAVGNLEGALESAARGGWGELAHPVGWEAGAGSRKGEPTSPSAQGVGGRPRQPAPCAGPGAATRLHGAGPGAAAGRRRTNWGEQAGERLALHGGELVARAADWEPLGAPRPPKPELPSSAGDDS